MYQTVVVPVDLAHEEKAEPMITAAKHVAGGDAKIILVNAVEDIPTIAATYIPSNVISDIRGHAEKHLKDISSRNGLDGTIEIGHGKAYQAILDVAEKNKADLIIIASHQPGFEDYFLGSTAARVVRHAKCSVLVMR